ncbi:hypothetical protein ACLB2K_027147 [Fragaria x ananassa]
MHPPIQQIGIQTLKSPILIVVRFISLWQSLCFFKVLRSTAPAWLANPATFPNLEVTTEKVWWSAASRLSIEGVLADICHAHQLLKKGGLKDENIVVFMYDDIAYNEENPRQGVIINSPHCDDVYTGVPKDYTGEDVTVGNFFAAILGNKTAIAGGSGKVVDSGPNDHIFIYYSDHGGLNDHIFIYYFDHGGPGVLGMPTGPYIYADRLIDVLKKKHAAGTYKSLVFYLEACESGSIFEGLLPKGLNIFATTASNAEESSWGTYCLGAVGVPCSICVSSWIMVHLYVVIAFSFSLKWKIEPYFSF